MKKSKIGIVIVALVMIVVGVGLYLLNMYLARRECLKTIKDGK